MKINLDNLKNKNKMKNVILTCLLTFTVISLSFAQLKVVAPDGNVGIGTSAPSVKLQVDGIVKVLPRDGVINTAGTTDAVLQLGNGRPLDGNAYIDLYPKSGAGYIGRFLSNENGVSTFSHLGAADFLLRTFKNTSKIRFITTTSTNLPKFAITVLPDGQVGIGTPNIVTTANAALTVGGDAYKPGGGAWKAPSDGKLKNVSGNFKKGLDAVLKLNPVVYKYNGEGGIEDTETEYVGLIAQEYQKIAPKAVSKFKYEKEVYNESDMTFKKVGTVEEFLAIDPSQITYMLVNAVKEQQEIIKSLQSEIKNIKTNGISEAVVNSTIVLGGEERATLAQNSPNPFSANTSIKYSVPSNSKSAALLFTDISGKEIKRISIDHSGSGNLDVSIEDMPIGIYSYSLIIDGSTAATKKMVLSR